MAPLAAGIRRAAVAALLAATALLGCARRDEPPAEVARLVIAPAAGTPAAVYTLADETRPVLALPSERRLDLPVPPGDDPRYVFTLPEDVPGDVVATGAVQRGPHVYPLPAQLLERSRDPDGSPRAALVLPAVARGGGPPTRLALLLTTLPASPSVETAVDDVAVSSGARLELAVGLSPAVTIAGAATVGLEIAVRPEGGTEQILWSTTLQGETADGPRWREVSVPLDPVAGTRARFVFRARAVGDGRPVVLPLWADPTIVAPAARPPERRNVVLISLDGLRADRLAKVGAERRALPQLDAFARDAVVFTDAWSVSSDTIASPMSLFTSRFPSEHGVTRLVTSPAAAIELLAERLRRAGYLTRAFTEEGAMWAHAGFARGFSTYGERRSADGVAPGQVDAVFTDATRWVEAHADRTFFLFVQTSQLHEPHAPPAEYRSLFADVPGREPPATRAAALAYDQEARHTDDHLGRFLSALARLGIAERTIVVVTSAHGEELGEHGGTGHGRSLHAEALRVPLVIAAPGLLAPTDVTTPASLLDVAPTLQELLGLAPRSEDRGRSLASDARAAAAGTPADVAAESRPIFGELERADGSRVHQVSVRRQHATAILDVATETIRCYAADDRAEVRPLPACDELAEVIALHRKAIVAIPGIEPPTQADPTFIEKLRAAGSAE